jgi:hypothetical protein
VVLRANGSTWGAACLHREIGSGDFGPDECQFLAEISDDLGRGLQLSLARAPASTPFAGAPGVVMMDPELRVVSATAEAERMIALLPADGSSTIFGVALRDHIKSIFAKVGASSRSELMALASYCS